MKTEVKTKPHGFRPLVYAGVTALAFSIGAVAVDFTFPALGAGLFSLAHAAPGGGPPPGKGPGDGGNAPPDFGDLIILYRDAFGVPFLTGDSCWQPLPSETCSDTCVLVPGISDHGPTDVEVVPVDPATCAVTTECATCTQEVDFGRVNEARSPEAVFEAQMEDVVANLATADCVTLDPAGRLVASRVDDDLSVLVSTIDSPLQNLAIYRQLVLTGTLGAPLPQGAGALDTAARGLGAASDKTGEVNVDLVAYLNQIMGLSDLTTPTVLDPKICIDVKEEVAGVVQLVQKCFLDYGNYGYDRSSNFGELPAPAYIPEDPPESGWFEYLVQLDETPTFGIAYGSIMGAVFGLDPGFVDGNIGGFAQAADDTRAVISFMHENQVPVDHETPVPCEASGDLSYDVAISDVSGLQVPKNIVDGSEGREFTVTVAHVGGSDVATGTVTVTAIPDAGGPIAGSPWEFSFALEPGMSQPFTQFFSVDLGERTVITWTATAFAPDDVNPGNNTVSATSNVKVTGGGGRP